MEQLQKILEEIVLTGTDKYARTRAIYAIKNKTLLISLLDKLKSKDYNYKDIIITDGIERTVLSELISHIESLN